MGLRPILILSILALGAAAAAAQTSRRADIQDLPTTNPTPIVIHAISGTVNPAQQAGLDYQVPASAGAQVSDWVVYNFTVTHHSLTSPLTTNFIDVIMDRVSEGGDPDLYLFKVGENESVATDLNAKDHGMHQLRYPISWVENGTEVNSIQFLIGVLAWGSTPANFTLNAFTTTCATGLERGAASGVTGAVNTKVYAKVCGNPYHPTGTTLMLRHTHQRTSR